MAGSTTGGTTAARGVGAILRDLADYLDDDAPRIALPPDAFTSSELWDLECDRIFTHSWFVVARSSELARVGDYVALSVVGEPMLVVRDDDGLHALSAVCRHRFMPIVESGCGHTDVFTCPYHGWRYGLDGRLRGAPFMGGNTDFDTRSCRLPSFAVAEWGGFIWVNLDATAEPISRHLALAGDEVANYRLAELVPVDSWRMDWQANWKLVMENLHENYHVIGFHQDTLLPLSLPGGGDLDVRVYSPWVTRASIPLASPAPTAYLPLTERQQANITMLLIFPCSGFLAMGDYVAWFGVAPTAIDQVQIRGGILTTPELADQPDAHADLIASMIAVNDEDRIGLEAVQRGVRSRYARRGHLSPKEAPGVMAFYRNLAHALIGDADRTTEAD